MLRNAAEERGGGAFLPAAKRQVTSSHSMPDVMALIDRDLSGSNFATTAALAEGEAHLEELGINALELLIPAASGRSDAKAMSAPRSGWSKFLATRRATVIG